jgi:hypothetical protein
VVLPAPATLLLEVLLAIVMAALLAGCGSSSNPPSTTQPDLSISQLQREATAEHRIAEDHLRQAMRVTKIRSALHKDHPQQPTKIYNPHASHSEQVRQIKLSQAAQRRAAAIYKQMCDIVLQDPRTPHNDHLGGIARRCE